MEDIKRYGDPTRPLNSVELEALSRLRALSNRSWWCTDIAFKVVLDIDIVFFMGALRNNFALRWVIDPGNNMIAYIDGRSKRFARPIKCFNVPYLVVPYYTMSEMMETMVHETCHAFLSLH